MIEKSYDYKTMYRILRDADLFANGPVPQVERRTENGLRLAIEAGASALPGIYLDSYVTPLLRNLKWIRGRISDATMETLAGAVYDHVATYHDPMEKALIQKRLKGLLAVISNLYRSFVQPEPSAKHDIPSPTVTHPPLATFRPILNLDQREGAPFTLPADEVERLCGGKVAIVSLPSAYRHHPVLCWGIIAHEVGGHGILHSYPGLLVELQRGVRSLFYSGPDPKGQTPECQQQFLGLLWQYWTEETASDVCAVLNLGPAYGKEAAVLLAAINERIMRWMNSLQGKQSVKRDEPLLSVSWPPVWIKNLGVPTPVVNTHPTDILKLYAIIGAIESLPLDKKVIEAYIQGIEACITESPEQGIDEYVTISGMFIFKPGKLLNVDQDNPHARIPRTEMEQHARQVGRFIASAAFKSLNDNTLQDLATWDKADEALADNIKGKLRKAYEGKETLDPHQSYLGDDSQLLAGTMLSLSEYPDLEYYQWLNEWLGDALETSWNFDPIWGRVKWYPAFGGGPQGFMGEDLTSKIRD